MTVTLTTTSTGGVHGYVDGEPLSEFNLLPGSPQQFEDGSRIVVNWTDARGSLPATPAPVPLRITCPSCGLLHVDEGEFATRPHHTHACQGCGLTWRPAVVNTVGVRFLPGFRDDPPGVVTFLFSLTEREAEVVRRTWAAAYGLRNDDAIGRIERLVQAMAASLRKVVPR